MNGYVAGSDGNYYLKILEEAAKGDSDSSKYHDGSKPGPRGIAGNEYTPAKERYFRVEPIKWCVIQENYKETGNALLFAENALIANIPYFNYLAKNRKEETRTLEEKEVNHCVYKYSQARAYLNGLEYNTIENAINEDYKNNGLLQIAFTSTAQEKIADTQITEFYKKIAEENVYYEMTDKLFLLSTEEANYIKERNSNVRMPSDYALANNATINTSQEADGDNHAPQTGTYWWTRTKYDIHMVNYGYNTGVFSHHTLSVLEKSLSIVPALTIKLQ